MLFDIDIKKPDQIFEMVEIDDILRDLKDVEPFRICVIIAAKLID